MWDFFRPEDITREMFAGALDESVRRHQEVLELVDLIEHDGERIEQNVIIQPADRQASIVGYSDRYPRVRGEKLQSLLVDPFHMKNARTFDMNDDELELDAQDNPVIREDGFASAVDYLEKLRQNLMVNAVLSVLTTKQFAYENGDINILIPFSEQIGDLSAPSTAWDQASPEPYKAQDNIKEEYFAETGQEPTLTLVSGKTASTIKQIDEVSKIYQKQAPRDPDVETFDEFDFDNMLYRTMRRKRMNSSGNLVDAIPEGLGIVMAPTIDETGGSPIQWHRAANKENQQDTSGPYLRAWPEGPEVRAATIGSYDNGLPGIAKRNAVMLVQLYPTP